MLVRTYHHLLHVRTLVRIEVAQRNEIDGIFCNRPVILTQRKATGRDLASVPLHGKLGCRLRSLEARLAVLLHGLAKFVILAQPVPSCSDEASTQESESDSQAHRS